MFFYDNLKDQLLKADSKNKKGGRLKSFYLPLRREDPKKNKIEGQIFASWGLSASFPKLIIETASFFLSQHHSMARSNRIKAPKTIARRITRPMSPMATARPMDQVCPPAVISALIFLPCRF